MADDDRHIAEAVRRVEEFIHRNETAAAYAPDNYAPNVAQSHQRRVNLLRRLLTILQRRH